MGLRQVQVQVISYVLGGGDDDCIKLRFFGSKVLSFVGMVIETEPSNQPLFKIELQLESGCCPFLDKSKFSKYINTTLSYKKI